MRVSHRAQQRQVRRHVGGARAHVPCQVAGQRATTTRLYRFLTGDQVPTSVCHHFHQTVRIVRQHTNWLLPFTTWVDQWNLAAARGLFRHHTVLTDNLQHRQYGGYHRRQQRGIHNHCTVFNGRLLRDRQIAIHFQFDRRRFYPYSGQPRGLPRQSVGATQHFLNGSVFTYGQMIVLRPWRTIGSDHLPSRCPFQPTNKTENGSSVDHIIQL